MTADEINQEQIEKAKKAGKEYQGREPEEAKPADKPEEVKPADKPAPSEPKSAKEEVETDK